jgi:hypothetical protein
MRALCYVRSANWVCAEHAQAMGMPANGVVVWRRSPAWMLGGIAIRGGDAWRKRSERWRQVDRTHVAARCRAILREPEGRPAASVRDAIRRIPGASGRHMSSTRSPCSPSPWKRRASVRRHRDLWFCRPASAMSGASRRMVAITHHAVCTAEPGQPARRGNAPAQAARGCARLTGGGRRPCRLSACAVETRPVAHRRGGESSKSNGQSNCRRS